MPASPVLDTRRAAAPAARAPAAGRATAPRTGERIARAVLFRILDRLEGASLRWIDGPIDRIFGKADGDAAPRATVRVLDPRFYPAAVWGGSAGAGRAWIEAWWTADDLVAVVRAFARNARLLERWARGPAAITEPLRRTAHALRRNTRRGSRRNIEDHYDLGNEFFASFLDETMQYSSAVFERPDATLAEAQRAKIDRVCRKLRLRPGDRLLEIGSGWGELAARAASAYGCRVTTTTLSREQHAHVVRMIRERGLEDRVTVLLEDYRNIRGTWDRLASVEMIEAVGAEYLDTYFRVVGERLAPDGLALIQAIVIDDRAFARAARSVDFIKRYIFPGSCIPSVARILEATRRATDLRLVHLDDLTADYAETLRRWRTRFLENREAIRALGFDDAFLRRWEFYFGYCEGGFRERRIGDVQMLFARPGADVPAFRG